MGYRSSHRIFNPGQKQCIVDYIIQGSEIYYRFSPKEIPKLIFQLAIKYNLR